MFGVAVARLAFEVGVEQGVHVERAHQVEPEEEAVQVEVEAATETQDPIEAHVLLRTLHVSVVVLLADALLMVEQAHARVHEEAQAHVLADHEPAV